MKLLMSLGFGGYDQQEIEQVGENPWCGERRVWNSNSKYTEYKLLCVEINAELAGT